MVRVRVELLSHNADPKPCFVYVKDSWKTVEDLETHIKRLFGLSELELFVDDCLLPSAETIDVLCPAIDIVKVKEVGKKSLRSYHNVKHEHVPEISCSKRESKKLKRAEEDSLLEVRKRELLDATSTLTQDADAMDMTDDVALDLMVKRKRKRKHKSKKASSSNDVLSSHVKKDRSLDAEQWRKTEASTSRCHLRFDEDSDVKTEEPVSRFPEPIKEEWQEQLLNLAKEHKKPQFVRQTLTNGFIQHEEDANPEDCNSELMAGINGGCTVNGHCPKIEQVPSELDVQKSVHVTSAKSGDMLYFQRTYMKDCCPTVSPYILALVEEVDADEKNVLTLKILEGWCDEYFSPDEIVDLESSKFVVQTSWDNLLEPRLADDPKLLEKYL